MNKKIKQLLCRHKFGEAKQNNSYVKTKTCKNCGYMKVLRLFV